MKKVIIVAMLICVLCVCCLSAGVCYADDTSTNQLYYFEKSSTAPTLALRESASDEGRILLYIPHSYAFEKLQEPEGTFVKVKYNSVEGYINVIYFNSNCKPVTSKWGDNPYAYDLSNLTITAESVTPYNRETMALESISFNKSEITVNNVYGYRIKDGDYYFLVNATATKSIFQGEVHISAYIKATDTSLANFSEASIPASAGYTVQTAVDETPTVSGDVISSGSTTPSLEGGSSTQTPKNSLDRYILIAVIAVLCVVIVILIFVPSRKRQN